MIDILCISLGLFGLNETYCLGESLRILSVNYGDKLSLCDGSGEALDYLSIPLLRSESFSNGTNPIS